MHQSAINCLFCFLLSIIMATPSVVIDDDDVVDQVQFVDKVSDTKEPVDIVDLMDDESESSEESEASEGEKTISSQVGEEDNSPNHADTTCNEDYDRNDKEKDFVLLLKSNNLLNRIVKKALSLSNHATMQLSTKTAISLYKNINSNVKKSESFLEVLKKILGNLKHDPSHKYLHIKTLCEELRRSLNLSSGKRHSERLATKKRQRSKLRNIQKAKKKRKATKKTDVIDLDDSDEDKDLTVVDIGDSDDENDVLIVEDTTNNESFTQSNKENSNMDKDKISDLEVDQLLSPNNLEKSSNESSLEDIQVTNTEKDKRNIICPERDQNLNSTNTYKDNNNTTSELDLLVLDESKQGGKHSHNLDLIKIEKEIEFYKKRVEELEDQEVTCNSQESPYVQSDKYKAKIVVLYKKLCKLTGGDDENLERKRGIRLQVSQGHPPGPVRRLERYLNSNIDEAGFIPLPDFHDVLKCVRQSNIVDKLGWNKHEIMNEAMGLFTQCGHALRKIRQRREYKDLMRFVQDKSLDDKDPANNDPLLSARLEENKRLAKTRESEVFDRYAKMEYMNKCGYNENNIRIEHANSDSDSEIDTKNSKTVNVNDSKKTRQSNGCYNRIEYTDSESNSETRPSKRIKTVVTQEITNFTMPIISQTYSHQEGLEIHELNDSFVILENSNIVKKSREEHKDNNINDKNLLSCDSKDRIVYTQRHNTVVIEETEMRAEPVVIECNSLKESLESTDFTAKNVIRSQNNGINFEQRLYMEEPVDIPYSTLEELHVSNTDCTKENVNILQDSNADIEETQIEENLTDVHNDNFQDSNDINGELVGYQINTTQITDNSKINERTQTKEHMNKQININETQVTEKNLNGLIRNHQEDDAKIKQNSVEESQNRTQLIKTINFKQESDMENNIQTNDPKVKCEPTVRQSQDIQRLLDELGDHYISTIFDIEDPFLVVEISSDSSSDEDL